MTKQETESLLSGLAEKKNGACWDCIGSPPCKDCDHEGSFVNKELPVSIGRIFKLMRHNIIYDDQEGRDKYYKICEDIIESWDIAADGETTKSLNQLIEESGWEEYTVKIHTDYTVTGLRREDGAFNLKEETRLRLLSPSTRALVEFIDNLKLKCNF